jgi:adenylylsulfate kinase-like enzyme
VERLKIFTGIDSAFVAPELAEIYLKTTETSLEKFFHLILYRMKQDGTQDRKHTLIHA